MESGRYWNDSTDYLEHHGVLGMKWGVRRYQNADGSLTDKGKKRYYVGSSDKKKRAKGYQRRLNDLDEERVHTRNQWREYSGNQALRENDLQVKNVESEINKTIKQAAAEGMSINSKNCTRYEGQGKVQVGYLLGGIPGAVVGYEISKSRNETMVTSGRKYKVSTKGPGGLKSKHPEDAEYETASSDSFKSVRNPDYYKGIQVEDRFGNGSYGTVKRKRS